MAAVKYKHMNRRYIIAFARLACSILTFYVLVALIITLRGNQQFHAVNFFSYFTNLSNIFAATVLAMSGLYLLTHRKPSATDDLIRGAAVLYMAITGAVYALFLSGEDLGLLSPFNNFILHTFMPIVVIADWLYQPQRTQLTSKQTLWWLLFPLGFLMYSLIRGAQLGWYPYPFLNPVKVGGYDAVALYCLVILGFFLLLSFALRKLGTVLKRHIP